MSGVQGAGPPGGGFKGGSAPFASLGSRAAARRGAGQCPAKKILTFNYIGSTGGTPAPASGASRNINDMIDGRHFSPLARMLTRQTPARRLLTIGIV